MARDIYHVLDQQWFPNSTMQQVEGHLGLDKATLCRMKIQGQLSLDALVYILIRSKRAWAELPSLPTIDEQKMAGREGVRELFKMDPGSFYCVLSLIRHAAWFQVQSLWSSTGGHPTERASDADLSRFRKVLNEILDDACQMLDRAAFPIGCTAQSSPEVLMAALLKLDHRFRQMFFDNLNLLD